MTQAVAPSPQMHGWTPIDLQHMADAAENLEFRVQRAALHAEEQLQLRALFLRIYSELLFWQGEFAYSARLAKAQMQILLDLGDLEQALFARAHFVSAASHHARYQADSEHARQQAFDAAERHASELLSIASGLSSDPFSKALFHCARHWHLSGLPSLSRLFLSKSLQLQPNLFGLASGEWTPSYWNSRHLDASWRHLLHELSQP